MVVCVIFGCLASRKERTTGCRDPRPRLDKDHSETVADPESRRALGKALPDFKS